MSRRRHHLAIDAVGTKSGGGGVVILETLAAAAANPEIERVTLYCSRAEARLFQPPAADWLDVVDRPVEDRSMLARTAWLAHGFEADARRRGADALLALNGARRGQLPLTVFAQQSIPLSEEALERLPNGQRLRMHVIRAFLWDACQRADRIAVQTSWMREALVSQLHAAPERVVVVGTAAKPPPSAGGVPEALRGVTRGDAVLYVGSDLPHKNLEVLGPAMRRVKGVRPRARLFLTLPPEHALVAEGHVSLGYLDERALAAAYEASDVLVFPSLVESAGLPLIEAMSLGLPIIAADRPYAHDMCGGAALYFDPTDSDALAAGILALLQDDELRRRLAGEGRARADRFAAPRPYERLVALAIAPGRR
jgi:glycosyltransferase involved in cell wall biosynthesis